MLYIFPLFFHLDLFGWTGWCVWEYFHVFKNTKSGYFVWWGDYTFFFRYFIFVYFSKQPKQNHNLEYYQGKNYHLYSTVDIIFCIYYSLILMRTVWIYFINVLIFFDLCWLDLFECDFSESDLNFDICLDLHAFSSHCIIDANIHISQPHITVV